MGLSLGSLSFPRQMPELLSPAHVQPLTRAMFRLQQRQSRVPTWGAMTQVANIATDLWIFEATTTELDFGQAQDYLAWIDSLRGGLRKFKLWDPALAFPRNYRTGWAGLVRAGGSTPFDGTAAISVIGAQRDTISVNTLPAGFAIEAGDMVSVAFGASSRALHRIMAAATANGSGVAALTIEPSLPLGIAVNAAVTFEKPYCLAAIDAGSVRPNWTSARIATISYSANQVY